jgi:hypothetical protein
MSAQAIALFAIAASMSAGAAAQTVHMLDVRVSNRQSTYRLGEKITLTPLTPPPDSLHVRVFFDSIAHLKAYKADRDKCVRYYTNILWGIGYPDSIHLDAIHDLVRRGSHGKPVTVTLVFEDMDNPEPGGFGLKPDSVANYFRHAFEIQIVPSDTADSVEDKVVQRFIETAHASSAVSPVRAPAESVSTPPPPPCFRVDSHPASQSAGTGETTVQGQEARMSAVGCGDQPVTGQENLKLPGL